jgi:hypothetical protein
LKKNEVGMACSSYRGERGCMKGFDGEKLREGDHLEERSVDGWIILRWIFENCDGEGMDRIDLAHDRERSRVLVHALINLRVPYNAGYFLTS